MAIRYSVMIGAESVLPWGKSPQTGFMMRTPARCSAWRANKMSASPVRLIFDFAAPDVPPKSMNYAILGGLEAMATPGCKGRTRRSWAF
jgi:hypothetical protein